MATIDLRHVRTPEQAKRAMDAGMAQVRAVTGIAEEQLAPHCRWCKRVVCRGLPCSCDRAQKELASIRAGTER